MASRISSSRGTSNYVSDAGGSNSSSNSSSNNNNTGSIYPDLQYSSVINTRSINNNSSGTVTDSATRKNNTITDTGRRRCCLWNLICCNWCWCCRKRTSSSVKSNHNHQSGGCYFGCYVNEENRPIWLAWIYSLTKTIVWKITHVFFSLFLLFGPAIQDFVADIGEIGDLIFMVIRICMLLFFITDIAVRCITEENYFICSIFKRGSNGHASRSGSNNGDGLDSTFAIGSFLFWCDLISTASILYDLSFINKGRYATINSIWEVEDGSLKPLSYNKHYQFIHRLAANNLECDVLFVIMRTARCARFVQSRDVVAASNKINMLGFYKLSQKLNPFHYYHSWMMKRAESSINVVERNEKSLFQGGGKRPSKHTTEITTMLTAVDDSKAEKKDTREKKGKDNAAFEQGAWDKVKNTVFRKADKNLAIKHGAAKKIQRAWRNHVRLEFDGEWGDFANPSQASFGTSFRSRQGSMPDLMKRRSTLASFTEVNDSVKRSGEFAPKSRFQSRAGKGLESQVGSDMRIATGQRVAIGILLVLFFTVLFTYTESSLTRVRTMVALHTLTTNPSYRKLSLQAAVDSSIPLLYEYKPANATKIDITNDHVDTSKLRARDIMNITIKSNSRGNSEISYGLFDNSKSVREAATVEIASTFFIILFWFVGVLSFSGPVTLLVILPIEQMVRLLGMLTSDPLGYQNTPEYKRFLDDEDATYKHSRWEKDIIRGMETSFLKLTIQRISKLMKVGFGSAGVEIIQNNLEKGQNTNMLILNSQGSTVSCIFLFCDIRQFTDATEQLQEEVFAFTNRIAAVVHSICNSFGGAANKNIGDAFLVSWPLDNKGSNEIDSSAPLRAKSNQADKALLSVIKICIYLTYDNFFLEPLSDAARGRLKTKLKDRAGSVVQMGFGLHAGKAVQGAIGSQRKIDATYVSESVERSELLESSTKKYGLKMLMSGDFHKLLHSITRKRCRKVDRVLLLDNDDECNKGNDELRGDLMALYTFDMDVDSLQRSYVNPINSNNGDVGTVSDAPSRTTIRNRRRSQVTTLRGKRKFLPRKSKTWSNRDIVGGADESFHMMVNSSNPLSEVNNGVNSNSALPNIDEYRNNSVQQTPPTLPSGPALYSHNVWQSPDMKKIRDRYDKSMFFQKYNAGLKAYYDRDWKNAKNYFQAILNDFDDGPTKYFMEQIKQNNGVPPKDFREYGTVD